MAHLAMSHRETGQARAHGMSLPEVAGEPPWTSGDVPLKQREASYPTSCGGVRAASEHRCVDAFVWPARNIKHTLVGGHSDRGTPGFLGLLSVPGPNVWCHDENRTIPHVLPGGAEA